VLYVYALADAAPTPLPPCEGHDGASLLSVTGGGVAAVCSRHDRLELAVEEDHLWRHERVAEALMDDRAVLPVRFGTTLADDDALVAMLEERGDEFRAALDRVRGRVEVAVRALWTPPEPPAADVDATAGPGHAYLLGRLAVRAAGERLADSLHGELAAHAVDARRRVLETPRLLLSAAYLVDRGAVVDELLAAADAAARRHPGVELLCTGPWPPHTFADAGAVVG
jgi:Gas vesicle synthesis protein GvpL/GvpF